MLQHPIASGSVRACALFAALSLVSACGGGGGGNTPDGGGMDASTDAAMDAPPWDAGSPPVAVLEIQARDIWGQGLPEADATLSVTRDGVAVPFSGWPVIQIPLVDAGSYTIALDAAAHWPVEIVASFDGSATGTGVTITTGATASGQGISVGHETRDFAGQPLPTHVVFLGLRHKYFSATGRPARRGNQLSLFSNGEDAWKSVHDDILDATASVHMSTWWWESDFELVRPLGSHMSLTPAERSANTIIGTLDQTTATKRIMVNQFLSQDGILDWSTVSSDVRDRGATPDDDFEFMGQANETRGMFEFMVTPFLYRDNLARFVDTTSLTFDAESEIESTVPPRNIDLTAWPLAIDLPIASYHQKFAVIDSDIAYVGGMNLRRVDWDTDEHLVFEPRRMLFDSTMADRQAVADHDALPDTGPRKDYMMRIEGPLVEDVQDVFADRWRFLRSEGVMYSENSSDFELPTDIPPTTGVQAQITATMPEPFWEHAIAETWFNAVGVAEDYIMIEDQYFRVPMLVDLIIERMNEIPDLQLIVITKPVGEFTDPGCQWTHSTDQDLKTRFPTRYATYQLRSFDIQVTFGFDETEERFTDMDVHSKMLIVDDVFLSVGSANKNNRGIVYEGELNVAVYDPDFVRATRIHMLELILPPGSMVAGTPSGWITQLAEAASWNDFVWDEWDAEGGAISLDGAPLPDNYTPQGFVYSLGFRTPSDCLIEGVGPDMT